MLLCHADQGFLPHHYETSPRQMFYHTMLAFTPVQHGLAPFCVATGPRQPRQFCLTQIVS